MICFSKLLNSNFFSSILISLFILFSLFQKSISEKLMDAKFPNAKVLPSGKYFILVDNGIYIYNSNFSMYKTIVNFSNDEIMDEKEYAQTKITEFKDNNKFYIICLVKLRFLYIFESQEEYFCKRELNIDKKIQSYNLIPLKIDYPNFHYVISYKYYNQVNFYHYRMNLSNESNYNNVLILKNCFDTDGNIENFICNRISDKRFICFYLHVYYYFFYNEYELKAIFLNETLEKVEDKFEEANDPTSDIKANYLYCSYYCYYYCDYYCFSYNIKDKIFEKISYDYQNSKTYYFPETNQYAFIYYYKKEIYPTMFSIIYDNIVEIVILDERFNEIYKNTTNINSIQIEFSFIYSITNSQYILISFCIFLYLILKKN